MVGAKAHSGESARVGASVLTIRLSIFMLHRFLPYVGYVTIAMVSSGVSPQHKSHEFVLAE